MNDKQNIYINPITITSVEKPNTPSLAMTAISKHLAKINNSHDEYERLRSWKNMEDDIKEIFLVYERQTKIDKQTQQYFKKIFEKKLLQYEITGKKSTALIKLLRKYSVKEAAYVLHFYNLVYLETTITSWAKNSPK